MPECSCGCSEWIPGGSSIGGGFQQRWYTCSDCGLTAFSLYQEGGNIFLILPNLEGDQIPKKIHEWIKDSLQVSWRANAVKIKRAQSRVENKYWNKACRKVGVPLKTMGKDVPEKKLRIFQKTYGGHRMDPAWLQPKGVNLSPLPPQVPKGVTCYIHVLCACKQIVWRPVEREVTLRLEVPPDPVRVDHDKYFSRVFAAVEKNLGTKLLRKETANGYDRGQTNRPWFTFWIGKNIFLIGPRKRVDAIHVVSNDGINTEEIRKVAQEQDDVTYCVTGSRPGDQKIVGALEVHAWDSNKLIEYLTILGKASLAVLEPA